MTNLPHLRLYRLGTGSALILAPLLFLVDNLLHPKELTRGHELEQVGLIADSYDRWQAAHAIGFLAILAFAPAVLGLAFLVRRRQPTLGLVAGALAIAGLLGLAAAITIDGFAWGVAGELATNSPLGPNGAAEVLKDLQGSEWSYPYYFTTLGFIVGMLMLVVGAARQGAVPTPPRRCWRSPCSWSARRQSSSRTRTSSRAPSCSSWAAWRWRSRSCA